MGHTLFSNFHCFFRQAPQAPPFPKFSHRFYTLIHTHYWYTKNLALSRLGHRSLEFCPATDLDAGNYSPWRPRLGSQPSKSRPIHLPQGAQTDITPNELTKFFCDHIRSLKTTLDRARSQYQTWLSMPLSPLEFPVRKMRPTYLTTFLGLPNPTSSDAAAGIRVITIPMTVIIINSSLCCPVRPILLFEIKVVYLVQERQVLSGSPGDIRQRANMLS